MRWRYRSIWREELPQEQRQDHRSWCRPRLGPRNLEAQTRLSSPANPDHYQGPARPYRPVRRQQLRLGPAWWWPWPLPWFCVCRQSNSKWVLKGGVGESYRVRVRVCWPWLRVVGDMDLLWV
jgi:hypothetical protein